LSAETISGLWPLVTALGTILGASALTWGLYRLFRKAWLAAIVGGLAPGAAILAWFFYLEGQAPVGPYYAIVGLFFGVPALVLGLVIAILVAIALAVSDDGAAEPH
jgi:hypothetical protein